MTNNKSIFLGGLLVGALLLPGTPASADTKKHEEQHRWNNRHDEKWQEHHDRRYNDHFKRDFQHANRGHHNKPEIRKDFADIRGARKEVRQDRKELRSDYQELRKDRAELRRDIRNGASKQEIFQDRQEIRGDFKEIARTEESCSRTRPDWKQLAAS